MNNTVNSPSRTRRAARKTAAGAILAPDLVAVALVAAAVFLIQRFLFPLEHYWVDLSAGLIAYSMAQWLLIRSGRTANAFTAMDEGSARASYLLLPLLGPPLLAAGLTAIGRGDFPLLVPAMWIMCLAQTCTAAVLRNVLGALISLPRRRGARLTPQVWNWAAAIALVTLLYAIAFFSLDTGKPSHPALTGDAVARGLWFTIPVQESELFPQGYARLEDSVFDDLGRVLVAGLGQSLGLVEACAVPGPDTTHSVPSPSPESLLQPRFNYAVDSMCPEWIATLPGFFWRAALLGALLLALLIGITAFHDPSDFGILAVVLLVAWSTWPAPEKLRMGNVPLLIGGMPLLALCLILFRRGRYSELVLWALLSGLLFGVAAFVRRPVGMALVTTSILVLLISGVRQRSLILAVVTSVALLLGSNLVPATVNGMIRYRDQKLHITAPRISPRAHGSGFALLGGIGGWPVQSEAGYGPRYGNALDAAFIDAAIYYVVYDSNPLVGFTDRSFTLLQQTGMQLFSRYVFKHPLEFTFNALRKAYQAFLLIGQAPVNWPGPFLLLLGLLVLRHVLRRRAPRKSSIGRDTLRETTLAFLLLAGIGLIPAILTDPTYGDSLQPPAAVLLFTALLAAHSAFNVLISRAGSR